MAKAYSEDILIPNARSDAPSARSRLVAFVPIAVAIAGVAAIMLGRVTAHDSGATDVQPYFDPVVTGSIAPSPIPGNGGANDR